MIHARGILGAAGRRAGRGIGTAGYVAIFVWSLAMVMLVPAQRIHWAAAMCLGVAVLVYPVSVRRLLRVRWLVLLALLAVPPVFLLGKADRTIVGLAVSSEGLVAAAQIALRLVVVVVAVDGFTAAVEIAALAGLLERVGLHGLGFSMGVALNLMPALQQSATNAWHSLWMRGGLRRRWWRGLQLLMVTVVSNALRRAEEIALAAEARAFSPECARPMPVRAGRLDWLAMTAATVALLAFCVIG